MYKFVKVLGHIITWYICAVTIDKIDVSESFILNYFIISPIMNEILWALSYCTCNKIIYKKLDIDIPTVGSIGYSIAYVVYALILFVILIVLKELGTIPIFNDFDENFISWITQYFNNKIMELSNRIVNILKATN